jgi:hypothetical protein
VGSGLTVLIVGAVAAALIVRVNALSENRALFPVTRIEKPAEATAAVGVPLNTPAEKVSPAGSVDPGVTDQLYGVVPPVAVNVSGP